MADATVAIRIADAPQVVAAIDEATQAINELAAARDALGNAAAAFTRANAAWNAMTGKADSGESPVLSAYWQTYDHLIFTLRRLGYLEPAEAARGANA